MAINIEQLNAIEKAVIKAKGKVSPADLSAETGFALDEVNVTLNRLLELYESKVAMDKASGEIAFYFKYPLVKRGRKTIKEYLFKVLVFLWKVFQTIYKASIAVILVVYAVIFTIILLFVLSRGNNDNRKGGSNIIGGIFSAIFDGMRIATISRSFHYASDPTGLRYKEYDPEPNKGKSFIQSVYHYVFGPETPKYDPLSDDKEAIAYLRNNNYKLTSAMLIALTGADYEEADSRLARYISKFDGEPYISTDGVLIVEFPRLANKVSNELKGGNIEYYKDEIEPPVEMTGNSSGKNVLISILNTFNLIMSLYIIVNLSPIEELAVFLFVLGYFPLVFSLLFFIIPLIRIFYVNNKRAERKRNIIRKKLIGAITNALELELTEKDLWHYSKIEPEESSIAKNVLKKLLVELNGELQLDENGNALYCFPRYSAEILAIRNT